MAMNTPSLPEPLRARIAERAARPPLEKVGHFLHFYVADSDGFDDVRSEIQRTASADPRSLREDLAALEAVLAEQHPPRTLLRLVEDDGNWGLDEDPTDGGAAAFLTQLAQLVRSALDIGG
jgi:hypothetical protein